MNFSTYTLIHKNWYFIFSTQFFIVQLESKCNIIILKAEKGPVKTHGFVCKTWRRSGWDESEVLNHSSRLTTPMVMVSKPRSHFLGNWLSKNVRPGLCEDEWRPRRPVGVWTGSGGGLVLPSNSCVMGSTSVTPHIHSGEWSQWWRPVASSIIGSSVSRLATDSVNRYYRHYPHHYHNNHH